MAGGITVFLKDFAREAGFIGRMVLAYGELENSILELVSYVLDDDPDTALRLLFRLRSEAQRLDVADAVMRKWIEHHGLSAPYAEAIGAVRHCKNIRNQYAHCTWHSEGKEAGLYFSNLMEAAQSASGTCYLDFEPITLELLKEQYQYFLYTEKILRFVSDSYRQKIGLEPIHGLSRPQRLPRPNLHSRAAAPKNSTPR